MCFFLFLGIYVGGSTLPYYALPLSVFTVLGSACIGKVWEHLSIPADRQWFVWLGAVSSVLCGVVLIWNLSLSIPWMREKKEDIFLYRFQKIVRETEDPTLLNIGCLDAGLYTVCDIVPTCRWFQTQTINTDVVYQEQEQYIREGRTTYVLARDTYPDVIWERYELVGQAPWHWADMEFQYYLFRLKE